ncbi:DUF3575 domain-containing protein [Flavobacterium longum]|uniref:DUF3575 domain-containing protein n=1 Tax=Flavobacterium longum TaxID=1299340 RepID=UPI0039E9167E
MKKTIFVLLACCGMLHAQTNKHEIKWNVLNTITLASVEVGYEYFLDKSQSVGVELLLNDSFNMSWNRQAKDFKTNSIQLSYNFYTGKSDDASGLVITPIAKFRFGTYQETDSSVEVDMDSFILGIGMGYKWNMSDKFTFGPYGMIGRNFSEEVRETFDNPVEFNVGFGVGYRF